MKSSNRSTIDARASYRFQIPAEQVFDAWLDPAKVRSWMASALKGIGLSGEMRRVEIDPQVGGKFCFSDMRGGMEAVHRGNYLELVRPSRIAFTWIVGENDPADVVSDAPSKVTLTIEPDATGCIVTLVHEMDRKWAEFVARTEQSWTRMLRAIDALSDSSLPGS